MARGVRVALLVLQDDLHVHSIDAHDVREHDPKIILSMLQLRSIMFERVLQVPDLPSLSMSQPQCFQHTGYQLEYEQGHHFLQ